MKVLVVGMEWVEIDYIHGLESCFELGKMQFFKVKHVFKGMNLVLYRKNDDFYEWNHHDISLYRDNEVISNVTIE